MSTEERLLWLESRADRLEAQQAIGDADAIAMKELLVMLAVESKLATPDIISRQLEKHRRKHLRKYLAGMADTDPALASRLSKLCGPEAESGDQTSP